MKSLVFEQNFSESQSLDDSVWDYDVGGNGWGNNELQYYTKGNPENLQIKDGKLSITAQYHDGGEHNITSARIVTRGKKHWVYGRFVVRAKLPKGLGTWPAIWMLGVDMNEVGWPKCGEIDIMEHVGRDQDTILFSLHTEKYNHRVRTHITHSSKVSNVSEAFHDYIVDWSEEKIAFEVDGIEHCVFYKKDFADSWPFDKPHYLIINLAIGGGFGGDVDLACLPATMEIESIKVYQ